MADITGTTQYAYNPVPVITTGTTGTVGAGKLASVTGPLAYSTISYHYDELGRVVDRAINGDDNDTATTFDALGRVSTVTNPLGQFGYSYVNQTPRLSQLTYPNGQSVNFSYFGNTGDDRLQEIQ